MARPAHKVGPFDPAARQLETPVRLAAFGVELGLVLIGQAEGGAVIDRRLALGALDLAFAVQLVLGLIARIQKTLIDQALFGRFIFVKALGLLERLVPA